MASPLNPSMRFYAATRLRSYEEATRAASWAHAWGGRQKNTGCSRAVRRSFHLIRFWSRRICGQGLCVSTWHVGLMPGAKKFSATMVSGKDPAFRPDAEVTHYGHHLLQREARRIIRNSSACHQGEIFADLRKGWFSSSK